jgi:hypothetical protein
MGHRSHVNTGNPLQLKREHEKLINVVLRIYMLQKIIRFNKKKKPYCPPFRNLGTLVELIPRRRALGKVTVAWLDKAFHVLYGTRKLLLCSQQFSTGF